MLSDQDKELAKVIFRLLKEATTQQKVKDFLKSKGVPISAANWDELYDKRIEPALSGKNFTLAEFRALLQQVEEFGKQHCFLYQCTPTRAAGLLSRGRIEAIAKDEGLDGLLSTPLDLELPSQPTIVDVRIVNPDRTKPVAGLTIKVVERREVKSFASEVTDPATGDLVKRYTFSPKRAVSVAHLGADGILELRIASQDNQTKYHELVRAMLARIRKFIPMDGFSEVSLSIAKNKILKDRVTLASEVRYSNSTAKNDLGGVMQLSSSSAEDNLSDDDGSMGALDKFLATDGHVTGTNVYLKLPNTSPPREIHLLISGALNEFAIPVTCSAGEYEYVRGKILAFNT